MHERSYFAYRPTIISKIAKAFRSLVQRIKRKDSSNYEPLLNEPEENSRSYGTVKDTANENNALQNNSYGYLSSQRGDPDMILEAQNVERYLKLVPNEVGIIDPFIQDGILGTKSRIKDRLHSL